MSDKFVLTIDLTPEEHHRIEELARRRGFTAPDDYVRALIESDANVQTEEFDFDTHDGVMAGLRESWHQAMTGDTRPISELWDALDDE
jgi:hypothetical protein